MVVFARGARREYHEAIARYEAERDGLGAEFAAAVRKAIGQITIAPARWPLVNEGSLRRFVLRRFPFTLIYAHEASEITILAVAHGKRRPGYWVARTRRGKIGR